jgi:terminase small subunit-like protein
MRRSLALAARGEAKDRLWRVAAIGAEQHRSYFVHMLPAYSRRADIETLICDRLAAGASLHQLEKEPGFPSRLTVYRWAQADAGFAERLKMARRDRRITRCANRDPGYYDDARAQAFLVRVRLGDAIRDLVRRPEWPDRDLLNSWKRQRPDFAEALAGAGRFAHQNRPLPWRYDRDVADRIVARAHAGEPLPTLYADPALPGRQIIRRWRRKVPEFDYALRKATLGGHRRRMRKRSKCTDELTQEIADRIREGASLHSLSMTPGMPHHVTMYGWLRTKREFREAVEQANRDRAHLLMDQALVIAEACTPQTVKVDRLRVGAIHKYLAQCSPKPRQRRR